MKVNFSMMAVLISAMMLFSCSKQKIEMPQPGTTGEQFDSPERPGLNTGNDYEDSLKYGLLGWFEMNGNLRDNTGNLTAAIRTRTLNTKAAYTSDRNGVANKAIQFNSNYNVEIPSVLLYTNMSVAAWVKYDNALVSMTYFFQNNGVGLWLGQYGNKYFGSVNTPLTTGVMSDFMDNKWHHLAATYDGFFLRFYVDGVFTGMSLNEGVLAGMANYFLGGGYSVSPNWLGAMDDVRFYNRTLSAIEISKLVKL